MANNVFPVPGGPDTSIPLGGDTPSQLNMPLCLSGHSIISRSYLIVSFMPPTSPKSIFEWTSILSSISFIWADWFYCSYIFLRPSIFCLFWRTVSYSTSSFFFSESVAASTCASFTLGSILFIEFDVLYETSFCPGSNPCDSLSYSQSVAYPLFSSLLVSLFLPPVSLNSFWSASIKSLFLKIVF